MAPSAQIIPICLIGAGSDEIGKAVQNGGWARTYLALSMLLTVWEPGMHRAGDDWRARASSGDRLHPRLTHRACWLDRLGELHDRPSADGAGFIVGRGARAVPDPL